MVSPEPHVHCSSPVVMFVCVTNESLHMHSELLSVPLVSLLSEQVAHVSELLEPAYLRGGVSDIRRGRGLRAHVLPSLAALALERSHAAVRARFARSARGVVH